MIKLPHLIRSGIRTLILALAVYVGSYCCLSACGDYYWGQSGRLRYNAGFAVSDVSMWRARFTRWQRFKNLRSEEITRGNTLGYFYCPMIIVDRWLVHPTTQLINPES
ncbi:MAG: hypothetical protein ACKVHE_00755 [Planctomycetales bacterium]|jgi:hypothetical protein